MTDTDPTKLVFQGLTLAEMREVFDRFLDEALAGGGGNMREPAWQIFYARLLERATLVGVE